MGTRFNIGAGFAVAAILLLGSFSFYQMHDLNEQIQEIWRSDLEMIVFAEKVEGLLEKLRRGQIQAFIGEEIASRTQMLQSLGEIKAFLATEKDLVTEGRQQIVGVADLLLTYEKEVRSWGDGAVTEPMVPLYRVSLIHEKMLEELAKIRRNNQKMLRTHQNNIVLMSKSAQVRMAVVSLITLLLSFSLSVFFGRQVSLPVHRLKMVIDRIREGHYQVVKRPDTHDEVGQLFTALTRMTEHIFVRDTLKKEKIRIERARFAALANHFGIPVLVVNAENQIGFANNDCLETFRLKSDDVFEVELPKTPFPQELKERLSKEIAARNWLVAEPMDVIGENFAYELYLTLLPAKNEKGEIVSVVVLLGRLRVLLGKPAPVA
jgi:PAS domain-containing protein